MNYNPFIFKPTTGTLKDESEPEWKENRLLRVSVISQVYTGERLFRIINNWGLEKKFFLGELNTMVLALARVTSLLCSDRTLQRLIRWGFVYLGPDRWLKSQKGHVTMLISAVVLPFLLSCPSCGHFGRRALPLFLSPNQTEDKTTRHWKVSCRGQGCYLLIWRYQARDMGIFWAFPRWTKFLSTCRFLTILSKRSGIPKYLLSTVHTVISLFCLCILISLIIIIWEKFLCFQKLCKRQINQNVTGKKEIITKGIQKI